MVTFDEEKQKKRVEELHKKEEEDLASILSKKYGVQYIDLSRTSINTDALQIIGEKEARATEIAIFNRIGKKIFVAIRSPNRQETIEQIKELEKLGYKTTLFMVSLQSLERAWEYYKDISLAMKTTAGILDISTEEIEKIISQLKNITDARKLIKETMGMKKVYRISRILEVVLASGFFTDSSDIHIEPEEKYIRLRYRIDGALTDIIMFDRETYELLLSRIKLISNLKLNIKNKAQDGRFSVRIGKDDIEIRTSILPGAYGESIVMRLLNPETIAAPMEELGIEKKLFAILEKEIRKPNGMILNTGPTGSGKTTTLYGFLKKVHTPEKKIVTIEDPIEYHLPGIVQTQVDEKNYTFSKGLRSALRQDPDIIMIGEIRDEEVAEIAINSALTGHLVFSTLHTNNAAGSFPRLIDLGVNPKVISSAVNIAMAQRLVRRLCKYCKKEVALVGDEKTIINSIISTIVDKESIPKKIDTVWKATGCDKCHESGYKGRIGVFEAIMMDKAIEKLVKESASEREINEAARAQGILTIRQDGALKILNGITTLEELGRVVDLQIGD